MTVDIKHLRELLDDAKMPTLQWFGESPPPTMLIYASETDLYPDIPRESFVAWIAHHNGYGYKQTKLIVEAVNALPRLLAELEQLRDAYNKGINDAANICDAESERSHERGAVEYMYCASGLAARIRSLIG